MLRLIRFSLVCVCSFSAIIVHGQQIGLVDFDQYVHHVQQGDRQLNFQLLSTSKDEVKPIPTHFYYWYKANKVNQTQGGYAGRLLDGGYQSFYRTGQLWEQGTFRKGQKAGEWREWSEQRLLISIHQYKRGVLNGTFKKYDSLGNVAVIGQYKNEKLNGHIRHIEPNGKTKVLRYRKGEIVPSSQKPNFMKRWYCKVLPKKKSKTDTN